MEQFTYLPDYNLPNYDHSKDTSEYVEGSDGRFFREKFFNCIFFVRRKFWKFLEKYKLLEWQLAKSRKWKFSLVDLGWKF